MSELPSGVIVLDKPAGLPSNRVLNRLKRLLGIRGRRGPKIGFLGTLDPLATGVLPVFLGKATRLISVFEGLDKTYRATVRLGQTTDTFDAEGTVTDEAPLDGLDESAVRRALLAFRGGYEQRVPRFSAVKVGGVPAYRLAREGREVPERVRHVRIPELEVEEIALPRVTFRLTCSAGTYVRALANDLGQALGVGGHLEALRRLAAGSLFTLENSFTLDRIERELEDGQLGFVVDAAAFLPDHLPLNVEGPAETALREGRTIPLPEAWAGEVAGQGGPHATPPIKSPIKALRPGGTLVAVGTVVPYQGALLGFQPSKVLI